MVGFVAKLYSYQQGQSNPFALVPQRSIPQDILIKWWPKKPLFYFPKPGLYRESHTRQLKSVSV